MNPRRVCIVTGASRGIGRACAIRLAQDFSDVVLVARDGDALASTAQAVHSVGAHAIVVALDLKDALAPREVVNRTLAHCGRLDALVNVAGAVPQTDLLLMTDEEWTEGLALKLHGARRLAIAAWDLLKSSRGCILFTSGATAFAPTGALGAVATINAAILAMSKAFSERGLTDGIQVNTIVPGPVLTDRRRTMLQKYASRKALPFDAAVETFARETGISRFGTPEDIAAGVAFAVSSAAQWMTGSVLRMDGGESKSV
jgi:3-oxoacyl-[acyl-carrier protein] reductase